MNCTIRWNVLSLKEWEERFARLPRANLLQSYAYARAAAETMGQRARFGLIEIDGQEAGMVQILEAGILGNLLHAVILDRGPLWFEGFGGTEHFEAFCTAFAAEFPARFGRKRRFIPEIENSEFVQNILKNMQFYPVYVQNYETLWLNLRQNEQILEKKLKKNWKSSLKTAKNSKITVEWDNKGAYMGWLLETYTANRAARGYSGASPALLKSLAKYAASDNNILIGRAVLASDTIAAILVLCHGSGATYQIGWSSEAGRRTCANHLLLWDALGVLRRKGIKDFDLGGVNDETAKGVKAFKQGMGGALSRLPGIYR